MLSNFSKTLWNEHFHFTPIFSGRSQEENANFGNTETRQEISGHLHVSSSSPSSILFLVLRDSSVLIIHPFSQCVFNCSKRMFPSSFHFFHLSHSRCPRSISLSFFYSICVSFFLFFCPLYCSPIFCFVILKIKETIFLFVFCIHPGQPFPNCGALKSVAQRFWTTYNLLISWFWDSEIVRGSVGIWRPKVATRINGDICRSVIF